VAVRTVEAMVRMILGFELYKQNWEEMS